MSKERSSAPALLLVAENSDLVSSGLASFAASLFSAPGCLLFFISSMRSLTFLMSSSDWAPNIFSSFSFTGSSFLSYNPREAKFIFIAAKFILPPGLNDGAAAEGGFIGAYYAGAG